MVAHTICTIRHNPSEAPPAGVRRTAAASFLPALARSLAPGQSELKYGARISKGEREIAFYYKIIDQPPESTTLGIAVQYDTIRYR